MDAAFLLTVGSFLLTVKLFLLTVGNISSNLAFFTYSWSLFADNFSFFTYSWSFFAYNGRVRLIRALRDCKQRSSTVSKKTPTVSKKASPQINACENFCCHGRYAFHVPKEGLVNIGPLGSLNWPDGIYELLP